MHLLNEWKGTQAMQGSSEMEISKKGSLKAAALYPVFAQEEVSLHNFNRQTEPVDINFSLFWLILNYEKEFLL